MIYETCMNDDDEMLKHLSEVENKGIYINHFVSRSTLKSFKRQV